MFTVRAIKSKFNCSLNYWEKLWVQISKRTPKPTQKWNQFRRSLSAARSKVTSKDNSLKHRQSAMRRRGLMMMRWWLMRPISMRSLHRGSTLISRIWQSRSFSNHCKPKIQYLRSLNSYHFAVKIKMNNFQFLRAIYNYKNQKSWVNKSLLK